MDKQAMLCRASKRDKARNITLRWRIFTLLDGYRQRSAEEAGKEVKSLLTSETPFVKEAWRRMQGWYKASNNRPLPPSHVSITKMTEEKVPPPRRDDHCGDRAVPH